MSAATDRARFDPWRWAGVAAAGLVLAKALGAPLGEPAAEDFDFLRHVVLGGHHSWLDGGGSLSFWRPLAQQAYYGLLGPLMLSHPGAVAAIHFVLLAGTTLLLYALLRTWWSGPAAAAAASFPVLAEGARSLLGWPGHFADLGCLFFSVLALHQAARGRMPASLAALAAALLCKEQALVTAALLPFLPGSPGRERGRVRWILASAGVAVAWAIAYVLVRRSAGLVLPHGVEGEIAARSVPVVRRLLWAFIESGRACVSLPQATTTKEILTSAGVLTALVVSAALLLFLRRPSGTGSVDRALTLWGLAWFALSAIGLTAIFPLWSPVRAVFGAVGLGVMLVAAWRSALPAALPVLLAAKLGALALAAPPPGEISAAPPANGDFMDFARMSRLQRLMVETRGALRRDLPHLAPHAVVAETDMPLEVLYAFGEGRALQAWYRDTTLRWVRGEEAERDTPADLAGVVQFQLHGRPQVAVVDPQALRRMIAVAEDIGRGDWNAVLAHTAAADSLQRDTAALAFRASIAARRAYALDALGRHEEAVAQARLAARLAPEDRRARLTLISALILAGDTTAAETEIGYADRLFPSDPLVERLRGLLHAARAPR